VRHFLAEVISKAVSLQHESDCNWFEDIKTFCAHISCLLSFVVVIVVIAVAVAVLRCGL